MGSGRDTDKEAPAQTPLPPAYQEKQPLPPDNPDPVVIVEKHEPPVVVQRNHVQCKRSKRRCCCYCCTVMVVLILCCTILPIAVIYMTKDLWAQPYVDISFQGSSRKVSSQSFRQGEDVVIQCHVDMNSRPYVPLVQWFHDSNEDMEDGSVGYKLFAVHNTVENDAYKGRFEVIKTETTKHRIIYDMIIRDVQPQDAGRYACQVPKVSRHGGEFVDEYQEGSRSSSSSSSSDDDDKKGDDNDREDHHDDDDRQGCWFNRHRRNDYIYIDVTK